MDTATDQDSIDHETLIQLSIKASEGTSVNLEEFVARAKHFYVHLPTPRTQKDIAHVVDCALHDQLTHQRRQHQAYHFKEGMKKILIIVAVITGGLYLIFA